MLALDNMLYLAKVHQDTYIRVKAAGHLLSPGATPGSPPRRPNPPCPIPPQIVLENSSREDKHECPFGRSAIELTKMLCEILQVGELRKSVQLPLLLQPVLVIRSLVRHEVMQSGVSGPRQPCCAFQKIYV